VTDSYRITATVKATLQRAEEKRVGRPISLRAFFVGWAVLLAVSIAGAWYSGALEPLFG